MTEKTNIDDIIGIVKTEEKTDSVELKKEYYKNQSRDKHYTYLNYSRDGYIGSFFCNGRPLTNKEVVDLLNEQDAEIERLKEFKNKVFKEINTELSYLIEKAMDNPVNYGRIKALKELKRCVE